MSKGNSKERLEAATDSLTKEMAKAVNNTEATVAKVFDPFLRLRLAADVLKIEIRKPKKNCPVCKGKGYLSPEEEGHVEACACIICDNDK